MEYIRHEKRTREGSGDGSMGLVKKKRQQHVSK